MSYNGSVLLMDIFITTNVGWLSLSMIWSAMLDCVSIFNVEARASIVRQTILHLCVVLETLFLEAPMRRGNITIPSNFWAFEFNILFHLGPCGREHFKTLLILQIAPDFLKSRLSFYMNSVRKG